MYCLIFVGLSVTVRLSCLYVISNQHITGRKKLYSKTAPSLSLRLFYTKKCPYGPKVVSLLLNSEVSLVLRFFYTEVNAFLKGTDKSRPYF